MFETQGYSKFLDLNGSIRLYYVVALGVFFAIFSFVLYTNLIVTITMIVCTLVSYFLLSISPKSITIRLNEESIKIDEFEVQWDNCIEWAVVDLNGLMEFVIRTNKLNHQFYYFYLDTDLSSTKKLIAILNTYLVYNPQTPGLNSIHTLLRNWGLR